MFEDKKKKSYRIRISTTVSEYRLYIFLNYRYNEEVENYSVENE